MICLHVLYLILFRFLFEFPSPEQSTISESSLSGLFSFFGTFEFRETGVDGSVFFFSFPFDFEFRETGVDGSDFFFSFPFDFAFRETGVDGSDFFFSFSSGFEFRETGVDNGVEEALLASFDEAGVEPGVAGLETFLK